MNDVIIDLSDGTKITLTVSTTFHSYWVLGETYAHYATHNIVSLSALHVGFALAMNAFCQMHESVTLHSTLVT